MKMRKSYKLTIGLLVLFLFAGVTLKADLMGKPKPKKKDDLVIIHTPFGDMTVLLYEETPLHKENFLRLAKSGAYDSTIWHRVIEDFMIQGGDVTKKEGSNEVDLDNIPAELDRGFYHTKGALAAARTGDNVNPERKSSSCQFYIVQGREIKRKDLEIDPANLQKGISQLLSNADYDTVRQKFQNLYQQGKNEQANDLAYSLIDLCEQEFDIKIRKDIPENALEAYEKVGGTPHLDGAYTVYGTVVDGLEIIDKVAEVNVNGSKPVEDVYITMEVITLKTKEITKRYGYEYPPVKKK